MIRNSRYKIPPTTQFRQYKAKPEAQRSLTTRKANDSYAEAPSDVKGYDLMFAKIAFSVRKEDFENF